MLLRELLVIALLVPTLGLAFAVLLEDPVAVKALVLVLHHRPAERRELLGRRRSGQDRLELVAEDLKVVEEVVEKAVKVLAADEIWRD